MTEPYTIEKANDYIREHAGRVNPRYKGAFHFAPPVGWINDPNGLCFFRGRYHLFYQYHPYGTAWGPMHWGHAQSADLLSWEHLPVALAPDRDYDSFGCFSGSAIQKDDRLFILYTGVQKDDSCSNAGNEIQQQCLAWSDDGVTFTKAPENPVIPASALPAGFDAANFRDPKVWEEGGRFHCVAAAADGAGQGRILRYSSKDLLHWEYAGDYVRGLERFRGIWECPDVFPLDGAACLLLSVMNPPAGGVLPAGRPGTLWGLAPLETPADLDCPSININPFDALDAGFDLYAPQTFAAPDGRRLLFAWAHLWGGNETLERHGWMGSMCLPRELRAREGRLLQNPVREIEARLEPLEEFADPRPEGGMALETCPLMAITLEAEAGGDGILALDFFCAGEERLSLRYSAAEGAFCFDRSAAGLPAKDLPPGDLLRVIPYRAPAGRLRLRAFIDHAQLEIFVGDGELVFSSLIFPKRAGYEHRLRCGGAAHIITLKTFVIKERV
ncbi:MAG: glycoside hydrolase family 32 protein [Treponema sp.]|jgi:beta-fructofuranosidase|nr:glycoside hydrolase family 32 protein [Treponema sp.]